ncbi:MAG TPA: N-acetyltransferase [Deferribacteraceae bacterium]|jgi:amino-acid N-acetyltransferase|nr:N-acetyltransferase [Deferribacteraceae bacterium]
MLRKATLADTRKIQKLVNSYASKGEMLPVSISEICERILEFIVWEENGELLGCCAMHPSWEDLVELRSIAVAEHVSRHGIGKAMVEKVMEMSRTIGAKKIFLLTYKAHFFAKFGFQEVEKDTLPKKIWSDCLKCAKFPDCDETAMVLEL